MNVFWNGYQYVQPVGVFCPPYYPTYYTYPAPQQTEVIGQLLKRISDLEAKLDKV